MKKLFLPVIFAAALLARAAENGISIPQVADRWIKGDVLTKQNSAPWSFAAVLHGFVQLKNPAMDAVKDTQVRIFHDRKKLYFGFFRTVEGKSLCNVSTRDGIVWGDDSIFLFVAPDPAKPSNFYQIIINVNGAVYDEEVGGTGKNPAAKNFNSLKFNIFKGVRGWLFYGSVDLAELGIVPGKTFLLNVASHRKETNGVEEYSTFAPLKAASFTRGEDFVKAVLAPAAKVPPVYSFAKNPELCLDGEVEFGTNERWQKRVNASASKYYKISGTGSIYAECKPGMKFANWYHPLDLQANTRYRISFMCRYWSCETPNLKPVRIHCYDAAGKLIETLCGPGIGNLGGGAPIHYFAPFKGEVTTPEGTAKAVLEVRVDGVGKIHVDALSVRKYEQTFHIPTPRLPAENAVLLNDTVEFNWHLFSRDELRPGTVTIECSQNAAFPKGETLVFDGCAVDPALKYRGWAEKLPRQGKWFWRAKFDGEDGGVWSKTASFTIAFNAANEKISPVISPMTPRGRMAQRPGRITIPFDDGAISSGIAGVQLLVNGADLTATAQVSDKAISFELPADGRNFYDIQLLVSDKNNNKAVENDFICISDAPGKITVDNKGFIAIDGKRHFPIYSYAYGDIRQVPELARRKYNGNMSPWLNISENRFWRLLAASTHAGLQTMPHLGPDFVWVKGAIKSDSRAVKRFLDNTAKAVAKLEGHPGISGVYVGDESIDRGHRMEVYHEFYRFLKKAAPKLIVSWLPTYGQTNSFAWEGAPAACDILMHDDYVINRNQHLHMFKDIDRISKWTKNKPFIEIIGAHAPGNQWDKKEKTLPKYEDLRYVVWTSICAGSKGTVIYIQPKARDFSGSDVPQEYFDTIDKVLDEVRAAENFLVSDKTAPETSTVISGEARLLEKHFNGKNLTIAVNSGENPAQVKLPNGKVITLPRLGVELIYR
ncbi:MAG: hypothetical protein E7058_10910 [Lentisphaerae bacterium]|nr:hypothetical protein [Lentisphaerota bacterium]